MNLFNAWIKKRFGIKSPSAMIMGYEYEYDYLLSEKDDNKKATKYLFIIMRVAKFII